MNPKDFCNPEAGKAIRAQAGYWAFVPAQLPPQGIRFAQPSTVLSDAEHELKMFASLSSDHPLSRQLRKPFMRSEAVHSSHIEGIHVSLADLYNYESAGPSAHDDGTQIGEVFNNVRALEHGLDRLQEFPVSLRLIRELQAKLMENGRGGNSASGKFRATQNWIGPAGCTLMDAAYVPPPVEEMLTALNALENFIHTEPDLPALVRVGMIHYQFEAIHPFLDGNGRVGRMLSILLLSEWELLPYPLLNLSAYFERHQQEYYDRLLAVSQRGEWGEWLAFFLKGVSVQAQDGMKRMNILQDLREKYGAIVRADRNPARMTVVFNYLFANPITTQRQIADGLNIPFEITGQYLEKLIAAGILKETSGLAQERMFQADEILQAVEAPEKA